ncbi:MAG: T9SS type A sorting domain-containing protein [Rhodothermales bacterium]|nr:T9SS type A sorting domain-containing protein [Rhodothermales bacterium]
MLVQKIGKQTIGVLAVLLLPLCGTAQPVINVVPSPVLFGNRPGAENYTEIINRGNESLTIDSLRFGITFPYGWVLDLVLPDTTFDVSFAFGVLDYPHPFPDISIAAGDTATVRLIGWDPCLVCKASDHFARPVLDTPFVFSNDPVVSSVAVPIDFTFYVGVDPTTDPRGRSTLVVFPNPAASIITIHVPSIFTGQTRIKVFDLVGRMVGQDDIPASETQTSINVAGWHSGAYAVQATNGERVTRTTFVVAK